MADQDAKEIPMNEVLASIRNIMRDNSKPYHPAFDKKEHTSPFNRDSEKNSFQSPSGAEDNIENDVNTICRNINKIIQKPEPVNDKIFSLNVNNSHASAPTAQKAYLRAENPADYSSLIVQQFSRYFAERRKQNPQLDSSVRGLAETAVINEIVPVLQQWLNESLPSIIQEEIKRVMAKAGIR